MPYFIIDNLLLCSHAIKQQSSRLDSFSKFVTSIRTNEKQGSGFITDKSVFRAGEYVVQGISAEQCFGSAPITTAGFFYDLVNEKR